MGKLSEIKILIRGGGEMASGVAWRLYQCGFRIFLTETHSPVAVRRKVSFCEAVYDGKSFVEDVEGVLIKDADEAGGAWDSKKIPVLIDPACESKAVIKPDVLVDAILAKKNLGTSVTDAPLVIALGPGFQAKKDAHFVVETDRGHNLGRLLTSGTAEPDTGVPGPTMGMTTERVLRAPSDGLFKSTLDIGEHVQKGDRIGFVAEEPLVASIDGVLRGLIRPDIEVTKGLKMVDIDPRGKKSFCYTISEKARAIGGSVLEGILRVYGNR